PWFGRCGPGLDQGIPRTRPERLQARLLPTETGRSDPMTFTSTSPATTTQVSRDEAGRLFGQTMGLVALTAGPFALGAYLGRDLSGGWAILFYLASFAVLLGMNVAVQRSQQLAVGLLFAFGALLGLAVAPTVAYYADVDPQAVWQAGGATALFIA